MTSGLGSFDPNVLPMDAFTLGGKASDALRTLGLKAPWIFGESTRALTSDLALRANGSIKWTLGTAYEPNDVVYHDEDGLWYMNLAATSTIEPDYSDTGVEGVTWKWVAGVIGGFVSGRGWWTKFADGTLIQRGDKQSTSSSSATSRAYNITFPIDFYDTDYETDHCEETTIVGGAFIPYMSRDSPTISGVTVRTINWENSAGTGYGHIRWKTVGRWKA